ncbi:hypothetical protein [Arthrobacter sp. UYCu723]
MTTLKEQNLRFLLMKTLTDMVKTETDAGRGELMEVLLAQFEETGTKSFSVGIPGAEKVATFTIAEPKPGHKVNDAELLEWCQANRPDLIEKVEHPQIDAWTELRLADRTEKCITTEYKLAKDTYITEDGEPIPGVEYIPAGTPKSFTVRYEKGGQERVIEAWRSGELGTIEPGKTLPQIGGAA